MPQTASFAVAVCAVLLSSLFATVVQAIPYNDSYALDPIAYELPVTTGSNMIDVKTVNVKYIEISIGFPFDMYGVQYTKLFLSPFGYISFDPNIVAYPNPNATPAPIPAANSSPLLKSRPFLLMFWAYTLTPGGGYQYLTTGIAPNRKFILVMSNVKYSCNAEGSASVTVVLYEGGGASNPDTGRIDLFFVKTSAKPAGCLFGFYVGISDTTGTQSLMLSGGAGAPTEFPNQLSSQANSFHYGVQSLACTSGTLHGANPCLHGGFCFPKASNAYSCRCVGLWQGPTCDTALPEPTPLPSTTGDTVIDDGSGSGPAVSGAVIAAAVVSSLFGISLVLFGVYWMRGRQNTRELGQLRAMRLHTLATFTGLPGMPGAQSTPGSAGSAGGAAGDSVSIDTSELSGVGVGGGGGAGTGVGGGGQIFFPRQISTDGLLTGPEAQLGLDGTSSTPKTVSRSISRSTTSLSVDINSNANTSAGGGGAAASGGVQMIELPAFAPSAKKMCRHCKNQNDIEMRFCGQCGTRFPVVISNALSSPSHTAPVIDTSNRPLLLATPPSPANAQLHTGVGAGGVSVVDKLSALVDNETTTTTNASGSGAGEQHTKMPGSTFTTANFGPAPPLQSQHSNSQGSTSAAGSRSTTPQPAPSPPPTRPDRPPKHPALASIGLALSGGRPTHSRNRSGAPLILTSVDDDDGPNGGGGGGGGGGSGTSSTVASPAHASSTEAERQARLAAEKEAAPTAGFANTLSGPITPPTSQHPPHGHGRSGTGFGSSIGGGAGGAGGGRTTPIRHPDLLSGGSASTTPRTTAAAAALNSVAASLHDSSAPIAESPPREADQQHNTSTAAAKGLPPPPSGRARRPSNAGGERDRSNSAVGTGSGAPVPRFSPAGLKAALSAESPTSKHMLMSTSRRSSMDVGGSSSQNASAEPSPRLSLTAIPGGAAAGGSGNASPVAATTIATTTGTGTAGTATSTKLSKNSRPGSGANSRRGSVGGYPSGTVGAGDSPIAALKRTSSNADSPKLVAAAAAATAAHAVASGSGAAAGGGKPNRSSTLTSPLKGRSGSARFNFTLEASLNAAGTGGGGAGAAPSGATAANALPAPSEQN